MMQFNQDKAIYLQIMDRLCDEILSGAYPADNRIPSVREYAALLGVNANTAVKAFDELSRQEIIYNRRGLGYFVSAAARDRILSDRRKAFLEGTLAEVAREMQLLGITLEEVTARLKPNSEAK